MGFKKEVGTCIKIATLAVILWSPLTHFDNTKRVFQAFTGGPVGCLDDVEPTNPHYQYDAIVIPGAGAGKRNRDGTYEPNTYQKSRIEAAIMLYARYNVAPRVIFLDGVLTPGEPPFLSRNYFRKTYEQLTGDTSNIPDEVFLTEHNSINTASNMSELKRITDRNNMRSVVIVTNDYHEDRATLLACANGIPSGKKSVETVFRENPNLSQIFPLPLERQGQEYKEGIEIFWQLWDPQGVIETALK